MTQKNNIKEQRDRFLAFAFASADLFLEITPRGKIAFTLGAAKGLTGIDDKTLTGKNWMELFAPTEQARLKYIQDESLPGKRCGPIIINMDSQISNRKGVITAIKMPNTENLYVTLGLSNELMEKLAVLEEEGFDDSLYNRSKFPDEEKFNDSVYNQGQFPDEEKFDDSIYNKIEFLDEAEAVFEFARTQNKDPEVTCFDFGRTETIPEENLGAIMDEIAALMRAQSIDGKAAGEIGEGRYSLIHDSTITAEEINKQIEEIVKKHAPDSEGLDITSKTIQADTNNTSNEEAARGLFYTIEAFENKGAKELKSGSLKDGLKDHALSNKEKIKILKNTIDRLEFNFNFMPIVEMETRIADHYEILCRFDEGDTKEWIMLGEDSGLCGKLDLAVCERIINHIHFKEGGTPTKFALNFSSHSLKEKKFIDSFIKSLGKRGDLSSRISIELINATHIQNLEKTTELLQRLREKGHRVGLDDFGIDIKSFSLLKTMNVDYIKIAERYTQKITTSPATVIMLEKLTKICKDMGIQVIAKHIEDQEQAKILRESGLEYGQGYLYASPSTKPNYIP